LLHKSRDTGAADPARPTATPDTPASARRRWPWLLAAGLVVVAVIGVRFSASLNGLLAGRQLVTGPLTGAHHWGADRTWVLDGIVYVQASGTLTIEPGTRIEGRPGSALVITRGARLHAAGTAQAPVVFTSAQPVGTRAAGDWGGLVLLGSAPVNVENAQIEGVADNDPNGAFGGNDANGSCGVLEYARIEFAGFEVYADNELNGLTLGACGSGTIVRHVQVHRSLDDGIELFGGSADLRNILISGAGDDSLDWDWGWRGRVQFLIAQQYADSGDNAFEADNNGDRHGAEPMSEPVMYNVTLVSPRSHARHHRAMTLREGTGGHFHNLLIQGFSGEAIDLRDRATVANLRNGRLTFQGLAINDIGARGVSYFEPEQGDADDDGGLDEALFFQTDAGARFGADPLFGGDITSQSTPDFAPGNRALFLKQDAVTPPQDEFWDEAALYLGAIRPGAAEDWSDGWTAFPLN
tara:strand:+ start:26176 stop:27576 length:1401 start_codon:yes stop_codon:yes gene_type:complete